MKKGKIVLSTSNNKRKRAFFCIAVVVVLFFAFQFFILNDPVPYTVEPGEGSLKEPIQTDDLDQQGKNNRIGYENVRPHYNYDDEKFSNIQRIRDSSYRFPVLIDEIRGYDLIGQHFNKELHDSCHFCSKSTYHLAFKLIKGEIGFVDAVIASVQVSDSLTEDKLVVITHGSPSLWDKDRIYDSEFGVVTGMFIMNDGSRIPITKCTKNVHYYKEYIIRIECDLPTQEKFRLKTECFKVKLVEVKKEKYIITKKELLTHAIPVTHCEKVNYEGVYEKPVEKNKIAIIAMVSQEVRLTRFLLEWLEYHFLIGIEHIFIYVHLGYKNEFYNTRVFYMLDSYVSEGLVTFHVWNYTTPSYSRKDFRSLKAADQRAAFNDAYLRYGYKYTWFACVDDDEYITITDFNSNLFEILDRNEKRDIDLLSLNSFIMDNVRRTNGELITEMYQKVDEINPYYRKSITRTSRCIAYDMHECGLSNRNGGLSKPDWKGLEQYFIKGMKHPGWKWMRKEELRLTHYYYKKYHSFNEKKYSESLSNFQMKNILNEVKDRISRRKEKIPNYESFNFDYDEYYDLEKYNRDSSAGGIDYEYPSHSKHGSYKKLDN